MPESNTPIARGSPLDRHSSGSSTRSSGTCPARDDSVPPAHSRRTDFTSGRLSVRVRISDAMASSSACAPPRKSVRNAREKSSVSRPRSSRNACTTVVPAGISATPACEGPAASAASSGSTRPRNSTGNGISRVSLTRLSASADANHSTTTLRSTADESRTATGASCRAARSRQRAHASMRASTAASASAPRRNRVTTGPRRAAHRSPRQRSSRDPRHSRDARVRREPRASPPAAAHWER